MASSHGRRPSDAPSPAAAAVDPAAVRPAHPAAQVSRYRSLPATSSIVARLVAACPTIRTSSRPAGRTSPIRSGHSTTVRPSAWRSSTTPPARASAASASRYRSTWKSGSRPRVLGHQHERRRVDGVVDPEAAGDPLRRAGSCPRRGRPTGRRGRRRAATPAQPLARARSSRPADAGRERRCSRRRRRSARPWRLRRPARPAIVRRTARGRRAAPAAADRRRRSPSPPRGTSRRRTAGSRRDPPSGPPRRRARRTGPGRGRRGGAAISSSGSSKTRAGGSTEIATVIPTSASRTAAIGPAIGRRITPSRIRTANGGSRWRAARWRASEARKSRRSLPARPLTITPADAHRPGPGQGLRVDARADDEDRAREADVERGRAQPAVALTSPRSPPSDSRPLVGSPSASTPRIARPWAWTRMPIPGRTSRTTPGDGHSTGSVCSPAASAPVAAVLGRASSPVVGPGRRGGAGPAGSGVVQRSPGRASSPPAPPGSSTQPRVAEPLGDRRARRRSRRRGRRGRGRPARAGSRSRSRPRRATGRPADEVAARRPWAPAAPSATVPPAERASRRSSSVARQPQRFLPRVEQLAAALQALRQPERHVAEVDEQAAEPAADVDREAPAADAEPDGVAEVELGGRDLARRQVDELEAARARDRCRVEPVPAWTVSRPALGPGPDPGRDDDAAERA